VTSEELATTVKEFCSHFVMPIGLLEMCEERILGEGDEQYSIGDQQTFEIIPMSRLTLMFREEVADTLVYVVMMCIRFKEFGYVTPVHYLETFAASIIEAYRYLGASLQGAEYDNV